MVLGANLGIGVWWLAVVNNLDLVDLCEDGFRGRSVEVGVFG